ncbi:hypothetical protein PoB_005365300 [Plakobranchus ocellatus]|uniref:Uncharacterized protein n=1 Tax=Plakobranchus ocellatus TaxID=259542 RepID=A0AAV4C821_9GAST|nr:hypothetical protein PoB_005365300 [Plakobranchus ocellatus]
MLLDHSSYCLHSQQSLTWDHRMLWHLSCFFTTSNAFCCAGPQQNTRSFFSKSVTGFRVCAMLFTNPVRQLNMPHTVLSSAWFWGGGMFLMTLTLLNTVLTDYGPEILHFPLPESAPRFVHFES